MISSHFTTYYLFGENSKAGTSMISMSSTKEKIAIKGNWIKTDSNSTISICFYNIHVKICKIPSQCILQVTYSMPEWFSSCLW